MSEARRPLVHVIVLHWGPVDVTAACLASLRRVTHAPLHVEVIDNGTPERGGDALAGQFPEFTHIRHDVNLGFADGNNAGLRRALETGAEYALLLNNDTEVPPDFLEPMISAAEADGRVALVNPKILYAEPAGTIWFSRGEHSLWTGLPRFVDRHAPHRPDDAAAVEMTFATGCALLMKVAALREIGLLAGDLFMYSEDLDISIRARQAGWKILNVRASTVIHKEPIQRRKTRADPFRLRLATRNVLRVNWHHGSWLQRLTFVPWFSVRWVAYLTMKNMVLGFPGDALAIWGGVADAVLGRTGPLGRKP